MLHMRIIKLTLLFSILFFALSVVAQKNQPKFKFGDVKAEDFEPKVYNVDSTANAVYLYDVGSSAHVENNKANFDVLFSRHAKIRLLNKNSFDLATVEIPLIVDGQFEELLQDFHAA